MKIALMDVIPGVSRASVSVKKPNRIQTMPSARNGPIETNTTQISKKPMKRKRMNLMT